MLQATHHASFARHCKALQGTVKDEGAQDEQEAQLAALPRLLTREVKAEATLQVLVATLNEGDQS